MYQDGAGDALRYFHSNLIDAIQKHPKKVLELL
jgi:hypothetical protein